MKDKIAVDFSDFKKVLDDVISKRSETINKTVPKKELNLTRLALTKEQFIFLVDFVQKFRSEVDKFDETISTLFDDFFGFLKIGNVISTLTKWISEQVGDTEGQYGSMLDWFLYEIDTFKDEDKCVTWKDGHKSMIRNAGELYDYFQEVINMEKE